MAFVGHKRARDLIVRWRYAGLDESEFDQTTGHTFGSAAEMGWDELDRAYERIGAVYRGRATPPDAPSTDPT
ncbi:hypothetical protein [Jiangella alkaliphila]|uniref:Uncharacterized protein n=1 Tax=Jiangella alkaliphila TaxID=419479 RepID=A0A1H2L6C4_9ACTN|nr:hypothetical protein [Jiangella alkaliphila]SDU76533.1 hypothetical protein SAMN04488563_5233 [Jiangella alkaliphila]